MLCTKAGVFSGKDGVGRSIYAEGSSLRTPAMPITKFYFNDLQFAIFSITKIMFVDYHKIILYWKLHYLR